MRTAQQETEERTKLAGNNKFELLLFRLGEAPGTEHYVAKFSPRELSAAIRKVLPSS